MTSPTWLGGRKRARLDKGANKIPGSGVLTDCSLILCFIALVPNGVKDESEKKQMPRATLALDRHFRPVTGALGHPCAAGLALNENPEGVAGSLSGSFAQTHQSPNALPIQGMGRGVEQAGASRQAWPRASKGPPQPAGLVLGPWYMRLSC